MKIAVSATGPALDAEVDPRFGRCPYFVIVDPDTMQFEALENSSAMAGRGAGIEAGQMIVSKGVQAVLTGNCGPNASQVFSAAGVQVITGVSGKIRDAVEAYKQGQFQAPSQPTAGTQFGMGMGRGMGQGTGRGGGMGMGRGRSMGGGMGMGAGTMPPSPAPPPVSREQELEALRAQSQTLAQQLAELQRRIEQLEKERG